MFFNYLERASFKIIYFSRAGTSPIQPSFLKGDVERKLNGGICSVVVKFPKITVSVETSPPIHGVDVASAIEGG